MTRSELLVIADRAETYPAGQGYTYIAGVHSKDADEAAKVLELRPELMDSG